MIQKQISFTGSFGVQTVTVWTPDNTNTCQLLVCADGRGEVGTLNFTGSGIGDQLSKGKVVPVGNFMVINVHKPSDGNGAFQAQRFKDTIDWALKTYPAINSSQVYVTGLSLSGGGVYALMTDGEYCKKIAAVVPVCGTQDASDISLVAGVKTSAIPFRAYGSSIDDNAPTRSAFDHYQALAIWADTEKILNKYGGFIDTKTGHAGVWMQAYDFVTSDLFSWLLTKTRNIVAPPIIQPSVKIATIEVWKDAAGIITTKVI